MNRIWPIYCSVRATVASAWRRLTRRVPRASRLGIAARLSIAFSVVAILTVAANQIAEHGSSLIRVMAAAPVVSPPLDDRTAESLPTALDQFQRAVLARVESTAAPRDKAEAEASAALDAARVTYLDALRPTIGDEALRGLEGQINAHNQLGAQLVRSSDARRRLVNELDIEFQSLDSRVKASLDRVWAVFGKVVGRDYWSKPAVRSTNSAATSTTSATCTATVRPRCAPSSCARRLSAPC